MFVPGVAFWGGLLLLLGGASDVQAQNVVPNAPASQAWKAPDWLMNPSEAQAFQRTSLLNARKSLSAANPSNQQIADIQKIVRFYLSQLTHDDRNNLPRTVIDRLLNNTLSFASAKSKEIMLQEIVARAAELVNHPDDIVRYNALSLVVQLSVKPAVFQGGVETPAVPYNPSLKLFIPVVADPQQYLACRILAAEGLTRICRDGDGAPSSNEKSDIAMALVSALRNTPPSSEDGIRWFRFKVIKALGFVDRIDNSAKQPIAIEALLDVIVNPQESWLNRAMAAQSISQLPYESNVNVPLITYELARLLADMGEQAVKAASPGWREPFTRLYLAFRPAMAKQAKEKKWGLLYEIERTGLNASAPYVKAAWSVAFPVLKPFVENLPQPAVEPAVKSLREWIQANPPASRHLTLPNGKEYPEKTAVTGTGTQAAQ
jgi:hypothetical protein